MKTNVMIVLVVSTLVGCGGTVEPNPQYDQGYPTDLTTGDLGGDTDADSDSGEIDLSTTAGDLGILDDLGTDAGPLDLGTDTGPPDMGIPDLGTDAGPPPPRFTVLYTMVIDNATGLTWERYNPWAAPGFVCTYTQSAAEAYCAGMTLYGGGWRLPTKDELLSIVDTSFSPTIDPTYFPATPPDIFTSTTTVPVTSFYLVVNFTDGTSVEHGDGRTPDMCVRCVR